MGKFEKYLIDQNSFSEEEKKKHESALKVIAKVLEEKQKGVIKLSDQIRKNVLIPISAIKRFRKESWDAYFKEFGWVDFIPVLFAIELSKLMKEEGKEKVWEKFVDSLKGQEIKKEFDKEYSKNKFIKKRLKIIKEAFKYHEEKNYLVSIPLFLSQIEGIIWDIGVSKGLVDKKELRYKIDSSGNRVKDKNGESIPWQTSDLIITLFKDTTCKIHIKGTDIYSVNFRHPIMHGRCVDYYKLPEAKEREAVLILFLFVLLGKIKEDKINYVTHN